MFKILKSIMVVSATALITIAESSIHMMCLGFMEEIELPEELKNKQL